MRALSKLYREVFAWDPHWPKDERCHAAYWTNAVAYDHVDPRNPAAVTACSLCNYVKGSYLLANLVVKGWPASPLEVSPNSRWNGLTSKLPALRARLGALRS